MNETTGPDSKTAAAIRSLAQISVEQAQELSRHRVGLIRAYQRINQCDQTGHRCVGRECKCCMDYEEAVHVG